MFDKPKYMKSYNREHYQQQREWKKQHLDRARELARSYSKKYKIWSINNPEKRKAANHAHRKLPIYSQCEICGSRENLERHHPDYEFVEIIVTCCKSCHYYLNRSVLQK